MWLRYKKAVKSTNGLIKHVNACKILVALPSHPFLKLKQALEYNNTSNPLNVLLDNNKKNLRLININEQKLATLSNSMSQNRLLSKLSSTFREVTFNKSEFLADILILKTKYKHPRSQKKDLYYRFND